VGDIHGVGGSPRRELMWAAARTSIGLGALFLVAYFGTNWLASQRDGVNRDGVGTWCYDWELALPFVPLLIIPYMSIDLFFMAGPFLCRDRQEMKTLARRMALAVLIASACFLLFPFRLKFEKPELDGWTGTMFRQFCEVDLPYNLVPSLHIALLTILGDLYGRHTSGLWRGFVFAWFGLIGVSTVLTYQHQIIDVISGAALGTACFYLAPDPRFAWAPARNGRIAIYYGIAAAGLAVAAWAIWPWGWLLVWPAATLVIATAGYCGLGTAIYHKIDGRLTLSTRLIMGPLLLGQWLSLLYYRRQCRAWDEVIPGLLIGRQLTEREAAAAVREGVTAVLDLTAEFSETWAFLGTTYHNLRILDLTAPSPSQLREAVAFLREETEKGTVYVHCKIGYSRSAAVIGAYLLAVGQAATADQAISMLRQVRPSIIVRPEAANLLRGLERERAMVVSMS
jgi:predicted protein tyrosine phosphatase